MSEITNAKEGHFCWVELQTNAPAAAKKFYGTLFGWTFEGTSMAGGTYSLAKLGDKLVGGLMLQPEEVAKMGAPPTWGCYVAVKDVAATTEAATRLGGRALKGPTSVDTGTFSVVQDPSGGVFMPWKGTQPMGTFLYGEIGALTWNELLSNNIDAAQRFYSQLLGWKAEPMSTTPGMTYVVFKQGDEMVGGLMPQPKEAAGAPSLWASYFAVADADATFASAPKLGAKVVMPLADFPDVGRLGWLQDPQGAVFAIIKTSPRA
jgi:predicted enzyme related to lactoylglutathione lyase